MTVGLSLLLSCRKNPVSGTLSEAHYSNCSETAYIEGIGDRIHFKASDFDRSIYGVEVRLLYADFEGARDFNNPRIQPKSTYIATTIINHARDCLADSVVGRVPEGFFRFHVNEGEVGSPEEEKTLRTQRLESVLRRMEEVKGELLTIQSREEIKKRMPQALQVASPGLVEISYDAINQAILRYYERSHEAMKLIPLTAEKMLRGMDDLKEDLISIESSLIPIVNDKSLAGYVINKLEKDSEILLTQYKEHINQDGFDNLKKAVDDFRRLRDASEVPAVDWIKFRGDLEKWTLALKGGIKHLQESRDPIYLATLRLWTIYGQRLEESGHLPAQEGDAWKKLIERIKKAPGMQP